MEVARAASADDEGRAAWSDKWQHRDERLNFAQRHDVELVRQSVRPDVELRVRAEVNELIGRELQNLQEEFERYKTKAKAALAASANTCAGCNGSCTASYTVSCAASCAASCAVSCTATVVLSILFVIVLLLLVVDSSKIKL